MKFFSYCIACDYSFFECIEKAEIDIIYHNLPLIEMSTHTYCTGGIVGTHIAILDILQSRCWT